MKRGVANFYLGTDTLYARGGSDYWMSVYVPDTFPGVGDARTPYTLEVFASEVAVDHLGQLGTRNLGMQSLRSGEWDFFSVALPPSGYLRVQVREARAREPSR